MVTLTFRPIKTWPPGWSRDRPPPTGSPFRAPYRDTLELLDRELSALNATDVVLQVDATPGQVRQDGQLRADAIVSYPGVILTFRTPTHGTLTYSCNEFGRTSVWRGGSYTYVPGWQMNLRAIALGLEALRKLERYGIANRGQQYAGWAELPAGIAMGAAMTVEDAARLVMDAAGEPTWTPDDLVADSTLCRRLVREAAKRLHPDAGGDAEAFRRLMAARDLLMPDHASR